MTENAGVRVLIIICTCKRIQIVKACERRTLAESRGCWQEGLCITLAPAARGRPKWKCWERSNLACTVSHCTQQNWITPGHPQEIFLPSRKIMVRSCVHWAATWVKWKLHFLLRICSRVPKKRNFINIHLEPQWKKGLLVSQNNLTDIQDHWSWNKTKNPDIWEFLREHGLWPEQTPLGESDLAWRRFEKHNYRTPVWNDEGDQWDYQLNDFNAKRKLEDNESQSVASKTEPARHFNAFQLVYNPRPKGEGLGCFIEMPTILQR